MQQPPRCQQPVLPATTSTKKGSHQVPVIPVLLLRQQPMACLGYHKICPGKGWLPVKRTCMMTVSTGCHQYHPQLYIWRTECKMY
ncbi:hypothetical protein EJB05_08777 [Eragrostis curvula]|uniref:Uncharacterized protein n=1 Tax=Eragrostis curvula TaxID=38414 RepID=A0A5J9W384_9POAL|nr:hypothetical protein EJB05_08777 [Eragrostis curvula]